jgi:3-dehydroquinate synthase
MSATRTISVELGDRSYPIFIGRGLLGGKFDLASHLAGSDCLVVSNTTVAPLYLNQLLASLDGVAVSSVNLPDGEAHKTVATAMRVVDELVNSRANRDTTVIALGGGVVGDITGFAAACYMRGVAFIQVPTTLLAQVDSSVGGKTGVNHPHGKNLIGAFHQPRAVLIDTETLNTLPSRELSAGLAEVIKCGAIADAEFFAWLEENMAALVARDAAALAHAVQRSCEIKAKVVAEDEREAGRRAILNFGHTFGHAIEHCQGYGEWLHGEAVAAGMMMAAELSRLAPPDLARLRNLIVAAGLPGAPPAIAPQAMLDAMGMDKKVLRKQMRFVLLGGIGHATFDDAYDAVLLQEVLEAAGP